MKLRRFHPLTNHTLELLEERATRLSDITRFNDPLEEIIIDQIIKEMEKLEDSVLPVNKKDLISVLKSARVACLTTCFEKRNGLQITKQERLMWAHYADSHRGVCLEYDYEVKKLSSDDMFLSKDINLDTPRVVARKVEYGGVLSKLQDSSIPIMDWKNFEEILGSSFFYKDNAFSSEDEFRIVHIKKNIYRKPFESFDEPKLKKVIFGINCSSAMKKIVKKILDEGGIEFYQITDSLEEAKVEKRRKWEKKRKWRTRRKWRNE